MKNVQMVIGDIYGEKITFEPVYIGKSEEIPYGRVYAFNNYTPDHLHYFERALECDTYYIATWLNGRLINAHHSN